MTLGHAYNDSTKGEIPIYYERISPKKVRLQTTCTGFPLNLEILKNDNTLGKPGKIVEFCDF